MHAYFNKVPQGLASLLDFKIYYIEDIYFFEVNTKYISSSAVKKISIFHECVECGEKNQYFSRVHSTSENADIFTARDEIYLVFAEEK